tara:strand:- start:1621 stop:1818 length:198 start_codon:yes stop_codon:yes gene_type:complete
MFVNNKYLEIVEYSHVLSFGSPVIDVRCKGKPVLIREEKTFLQLIQTVFTLSIYNPGTAYIYCNK